MELVSHILEFVEDILKSINSLNIPMFLIMDKKVILENITKQLKVNSVILREILLSKSMPFMATKKKYG